MAVISHEDLVLFFSSHAASAVVKFYKEKTLPPDNVVPEGKLQCGGGGYISVLHNQQIRLVISKPQRSRVSQCPH